MSLSMLMIILRRATKITNKALTITVLYVKWHVCATIDSFGCEEDDVDNTKFLPAYTLSIYKPIEILKKITFSAKLMRFTCQRHQ
ncbi:hypothetical protein SOVF_051840 [Spinacia oleracea]|nr:hypothetical protein SOVF_051840 [Spinacia oleracea]